jgi:hypothetical protein
MEKEKMFVCILLSLSAKGPLTFWPLLEDNLCYFARRFRGTEEKFFRFSADENQAKINLK